MSQVIRIILMVSLALFAFSITPRAPADTLKPINVAKLNTEKDEDDPFQAPGGKALYYVSNAKGNFNIMVSTRTRLTQAWPAGKVVTALNPDPSSDRRSPFLTKDGRFYYAGNAVPRDPEVKSVKNFDLYYSIKTSPRSMSFTQGTPVIALCTEAEEMHPWVTQNGKQIFFSRKTKDGWRVYVAKGPAGGAITEPQLVDLPVDFHHASLSPDGLSMYLQGRLDNDRWGLFRATRPRLAAPWSKPVELKELNHAEAPRGDMSPSLSADGVTLYFVSDRPGGRGGLDIWMIPAAKLDKKSK